MNATTTAKIVDVQVTFDDLSANSVYTCMFVDGHVGTADLADASVTLEKISEEPRETEKIISGKYPVD